MKCDDKSLELLLEADDDSGLHRQVAQHVESCDHCQTRLVQLAADAKDWSEAKHWLAKDNAADDFSIDAEARPRHRVHVTKAAAWTESMAQHLLSPPSHPEMLGRIGRYDVERLIGSGGMGVVFKAWDTELNRPVAVKLLAPYLAENGSARKRFAREARAAAAVVDEHVVAIHNVESGDDPEKPPFLVMKYIAGGSLQQRLDRDGPLDVCEILRIGMQTARGLAAAHAQGLIHRDVKPSNILLDEGVERALLTDFGLARAEDDACLTRSGFHPGTPHYMSPEQVRGEAIDGRSDLFSLGCVLYALCTGHPPFRAETSYAVLRRITDDAARPIRELNPNIPEWLERIVMKLLSKSRDDRFESAEQVAELLADCLAYVQHPTTTPLPECVEQLPNNLTTRLNQENVSMTKLLIYRMPIWFPCFLSTLFAFALSIKPAMSLSTLPVESALYGVSPFLAILVVTALGGIWGAIITSVVAKQSGSPSTPKPCRDNRPAWIKSIAAALFAFALLFAGVLIVLETNKGTLTIQCDADDVPIRIMQGSKVVEQLTVSRDGKSIRIAAGNYEVEVDSRIDEIKVLNGRVSLKRSSTEVVEIVHSENASSSHTAAINVDSENGIIVIRGGKESVERIVETIDQFKKQSTSSLTTAVFDALGHSHLVALGTPERKDVTLSNPYVCRIESHRHVIVRAPTNGYLDAIKIKEGQAVAQGDLLFRIIPAADTEELASENAVSIAAPFAGVIGSILVPKGTLVQKGDSLTSLADSSQMNVDFNVPEARYLNYTAAKLSEHLDDLEIELMLGDRSKFNQHGKLVSMGSEFNPQTGTITFRADFPNPDHLLRHGMTGTVILGRVQHNVIVIPQSATFKVLNK
ncbi:MAG TPA: protein kinase, partial [Planctomycetaceae bacterium]|nr:protein kinase [Planctomycetaceae bacterium]